MRSIRRVGAIAISLLACLAFSAIAANVADADVSPRQSAAFTNEIIKEASPSVKKMIARLPRYEGKLPQPEDVEVTPTTNPTNQEAVATLKKFMQTGGGSLLSAENDAANPAAEFPKKYIETKIRGVGMGQRGADGMIRVKEADGSYSYTHGADPIPAFSGVRSAAGVQLPTYDSYIAPVCSTDGRVIKVVHAYTNSAPPNGLTAGVIWLAMLRANTKLVVESIRSSGWTRTASMKVECYGPEAGPSLVGMPKIEYVEVPNYQGSTVNSTVRSTLGTPWGRNAKKYLTFVRGDDPDNYAAGLAYTGSDLMFSVYDKKDEDSYHAWNSETKLALVYMSFWQTHATLHELFHIFGAVNHEGGSYFGTGGGHCILAYATMCYDDNDPPRQTSPRGDAYPIVVCNDLTPGGYTLDCGYDTVFRTKHVYSTWSWLELRRNMGGAENSFLAYSPAWDYAPPCTIPFLC